MFRPFWIRKPAPLGEEVCLKSQADSCPPLPDPTPNPTTTDLPGPSAEPANLGQPDVPEMISDQEVQKPESVVKKGIRAVDIALIILLLLVVVFFIVCLIVGSGT